MNLSWLIADRGLDPGIFVTRHEMISVNDGRATFALEDVTSDRERLTVGEPALT